MKATLLFSALGSVVFVLVGCAGRTLVLSGANLPAQGMVVMGQGEAKARPDIARTNLGVEMRAETAEQATALANQRMTAVITALKATGVADNDLRTQQFSINFEQEPVPPVPMPQSEATPERGKGVEPKSAAVAPQGPRGFYRVSNMVEATIRNLNSVGQVLKAATDAGANNVWGISFELEDPKPLVAQARVKAMEHAKSNAEELARLAGVKLGPIVAINESPEGGGPQPMMSTRMNAESDQGAPVQGGEIKIVQHVQLVYGLP